MKISNKNIVACVVVMLFSTMLLSRCAHPATPQGGPRDSLPPVVVMAVPDYGDTGFIGKKVVITFDEYIQLKDQQKNFYTSPMQEKKPELTVKNKSVVVEFKSPLDSNTTYCLEFGNSVTDNNEGNILKGLSYVFSTGKTVDSATITGYTFDAATLDTLKGTNIFFFDAAVDSIPEIDSTLLKAKSLAVSRSFDNGIFIRDFIKPIDYRIYALYDANGNQKYERGTDMVGFLDSVYNPLTLPEYSMWIDTLNNRVADPQLYFRLFMEEPVHRHNLSDVSRTMKNRIVLSFSAPFPKIDSLTLEGFDSESVITEYLKPTRDSIALWIDRPLSELSDTIRGRLVYQKSDSVGVLQTTAYDIKAGFFEKPAEVKKPKEGEAPEVVPNPFNVSVEASQILMPEKNIPFNFLYPILTPEISSISLTMLGKNDAEIPVKFSMKQDTMNIRKWVLSAKWESGSQYNLIIPAKTFENIAGEMNDTLKASFTVADLNKFATAILNIKEANPEYKYIIQVIDIKSKKVLKEVFDVTNGKYTIDYIEPGSIGLRVIEDRNGNKKWDTGDLIHRVQPEDVRMFTPDGTTKAEIVSKANWEVEYDIDMVKLFAPIKTVKTIILEEQPKVEGQEKSSEKGQEKSAESQQGKAQDNNVKVGKAVKSHFKSSESNAVKLTPKQRRANAAIEKERKKAQKENKNEDNHSHN